MTQTWQSIEDRGVLTQFEQTIVEKARRAAGELPALVRQVPATITVIRDHLAGQPGSGLSSATADIDADSDAWRRLWCPVHEQELGRCDDAGHACTGEPYRTGPSDPTGAAVVGIVERGDKARHHLQLLLQSLAHIERESLKVAALLAAYPATATELPEAEPTPGEDYCRCCFKVDRTLTLVYRKSDGKVAYHGLCRWCGAARKRLDDNDPPESLVRRHLDNQMVRDRHYVEAAREIEERKERERAEAKARKRKGGRR